jgi:ribosome modulation factor
LLSLAERSLEMLPIQAMKQREQWLERHEWRRP